MDWFLYDGNIRSVNNLNNGHNVASAEFKVLADVLGIN